MDPGLACQCKFCGSQRRAREVTQAGARLRAALAAGFILRCGLTARELEPTGSQTRSAGALTQNLKSTAEHTFGVCETSDGDLSVQDQSSISLNLHLTRVGTQD